MRRWYEKRIAVLAVVWVCSAWYLAPFVERGWIPHDEGAFAHSAERVLQGELPHRDFVEIYTGGLSYLHAVAFQLFGVRLTSLRFVLLGFALAFVPALYGIASRLVPPGLAGLVTVFGVAWSLPNYFAGVPSWYNLFFATFGTLALLRHLEGGGRVWLVLAGVCGGLSILIKIVGIYFVAAAFLFLVYREQCLSRETASPDAERRTPSFWAFKGLLAFVFIAALVRTFGAGLGLMELALFVAPGASLCVLLLWSEVQDGRGDGHVRARALLRLVVPFALGVAAPLVVFLVPYVLNDAVGDLVRGVFVLPARRVQSASMALPPALTLLTALPYAALLVAAPSLSPGVERAVALALAVALGAVVATAGTHPSIYLAVWFTLRPLTLVATVAACVLLARPLRAGTIGNAQRQALFLLVAGASMVSLVQFPYAFGIYFCYAAPLIATAIVAVVCARPGPRLLHLCVLGFYFVFAMLWLNTGFIRTIGVRYIKDEQVSRLNLERATLRVYAGHKDQYEHLVALVREHAHSAFIYAAPDAPEVYFLTALRNPTRGTYDIFDDAEGRVARILHLIDEKNVRVVVINQRPEFSPPLDAELATGLTARFRHWETVGRFQVGWRD
jgi:hypothetical protein